MMIKRSSAVKGPYEVGWGQPPGHDAAFTQDATELPPAVASPASGVPAMWPTSATWSLT
jgi:hypothetical protein